MYQQQVTHHHKSFVEKPPKIKVQQHECTRSHIPNAETMQTIKEANAEIGMTVCKDIDDLFEQLGI